MKRLIISVLIGILLGFMTLAELGCGGLSTPSGPRPTGPPPPAAFPNFGHVVLVVEENHNYSEVIGSSDMPYLNSLASQYGLATQYFANTHPSIGNYFMLTTGEVTTNDDAFSGPVDADNIVRELLAAGKTWKSYAESIPNPGYTGGDSYPYAERHNILSYFTDVRNSSTQVQNLTSFSQFTRDLDAGQLPNFSFVVPNLLDDGHDGPLTLADGWLQQYIGPYIDSAAFKQGGLLIIVFDEAQDSDKTHGGGHVAMVVISPQAKQGFKSTTLYQHESTLRLILHGLGVTKFPGAASTAPDMGEFF